MIPSQINLSSGLYIALEFLVGFVVLMVQWASFQVDDASAPVQVVDGGGQSDLGSESVASEGGHGQLLLVHEPHHVV